MTDAAKPARDARRLFIGIRPSMTTVAQLGEVAEALARRATTAGVPIRWVSPATYHVTMKFLGWARAETVPAVVEALRAGATVAPFAFTTSRLGAFASRDKASVVWAGVYDCEPMVRLARALEDACEPLGFVRDKRPFHGHVTLGRLREPRVVSDVLLPFGEQVFSETRVESITLYESITKPTGSEYREVAKIDLERGSASVNRQTSGLEHGQHDATSGTSTRSISPLEGIDTDDGWPRGQGPSSDE